jgi:glycogen debranching enzyme
VRSDLQAMAAFCWWVLGINTVTLAGQDNARAVVPSKIGYVGLWQWDAYFIAAGLRHGDPELAREQLDLAFRFPSPNGQLPDVVHDEGVLASSDDLPTVDRDKLLRDGSSIARPDAAIPLTKPPLAAWALRRVLEFVDDRDWADAAWRTVARSQEWWFDHSDLDRDGMPEYGHPYSSGLDDHPIFDHELPIPSPDLAAYLVVQDDLLAERADEVGDTVGAERYRARANRTLALLERSWDEVAGFYRAGTPDHLLDEYGAVSLLPLLTGRLPEARTSRILAALADQELFATPFVVPTVARSDSSFSADRMWRGPVWVNINALLVDGLAKSGHPDRSRELAERTVQLILTAGGPHEYFNPLTGEKPPGATTAFGWSAALFLDLAIQLSE